MSNNQEPFQEIVSRNRLGVRSIQARYLQNQYDKMNAAKNAQKMQQKLQKQLQLQMLNQLNQNYLDEVHQNRQQKIKQMKSLSSEYQTFIRNREEKGRINKHIDKSLERSTLTSPTWIRDVFAERQTYKKNMNHYSEELAAHVKLQEQRKEAEKEEQYNRKRKIEAQAEEILRKEREELEARHRQKSLFEKRQNDLLGVKSYYNEGIGSSGLIPNQTVLRRRQQDLYSQGLQLQLRRQQQKTQQRRYSAVQQSMSAPTPHIYNPITNPIPFVYKNPNVLRMMNPY